MEKQITDIADLPKCTDCKKPVRPGNTKSAEYPGTVRGGKNGRCGSCRQAERRAVAARQPARKASDYGTPVTLPRVPSVPEVMAARTRHHKPRITRYLIEGRAKWLVQLPGAGSAYVGGWHSAVRLARYCAGLDDAGREAVRLGMAGRG